jgi:hypothetical protein
MHWPLRTVPIGVTLLVLAALCLAGCGGSARRTRRRGQSTGLTPLPVGAGTRLSRSPPNSLRRGALTPVGAEQQVDAGGARLTVTLRGVIDPLRASGARLAPGTRAVGVLIQIRNAGPRLYDSSATGDVRLVSSEGTVTPVLVTRGVCRTPLNDFDRYITPGEDRVGCVAFAVANGATLDAVWFSPHAQRLGRLTWAPQ